VTAPETPDELRARIGAAREYAAKGYGTRGEFGWVVFSAWPAIDALLARLTAAEDELRVWALAVEESFAAADYEYTHPNDEGRQRRFASDRTLMSLRASLRERPQ
jgi:hypothetical protein